MKLSLFTQSLYKLTISLVLLVPMLASAAAVKSEIQLVYSSDFHGELKPCGCTPEGNLGGILRRATKFSEFKAQNPDTIFVSAGDILGHQDEQGLIKADYMLKAQEKLGLDAILPGERDLAFPSKLINQYALPWVLTNQKGNISFVDHIRRRLSNGKNVLIYGLLDPALSHSVKTVGLQDPASSLRDVFKKTNAQMDDFVILLVHGSDKFVQPFTQYKLIDVIVQGHLDAVARQKLNQAKPYILTAGYRGQRIGHATFILQPEEQMTENKIISLPVAIRDHAEFSELYKQYDQAVTNWWQTKTANMKATHADNPYAIQSCVACHQAIYKNWQQTKHAHAIDSLKRTHKHSDPECLACHVTGMHKPGGFISLKQTPQMINVQCEACHGPGREHANYPIATQLKNGFQYCIKCHSKENSPNFDVSKYWKRISHRQTTSAPKHQQTLSNIIGSYDHIQPDKPILGPDPVEITEFFSFYCSRCYILNNAFEKTVSKLSKSIQHTQIPITFGNQQSSWASLAFIVAEQSGKGTIVKQALFNAKFEQGIDLNNKQDILAIVKNYDLDQKLLSAINNPNSRAAKKLKHFQELKKKNKIYATPTLIINNNLRIMPSHTGNNTNLMMENVSEVLFDIVCRQYGVCN